MRAVEEGVPLLRVANTGITAAYDATGRLMAEIGLDELGAVDVPVTPRLRSTYHVDWRPWPLVGLFLLLSIAAIRLDQNDSMLH